MDAHDWLLMLSLLGSIETSRLLAGGFTRRRLSRLEDSADPEGPSVDPTEPPRPANEVEGIPVLAEPVERH